MRKTVDLSETSEPGQTTRGSLGKPQQQNFNPDFFLNKKGERIGGLRINFSYAYGAVMLRAPFKAGDDEDAADLPGHGHTPAHAWDVSKLLRDNALSSIPS